MEHNSEYKLEGEKKFVLPTTIKKLRKKLTKKVVLLLNSFNEYELKTISLKNS